MRIYHFIALTVSVFIFLNTTTAQDKKDKNYALFKIKKVYKEINAYKNYKIVTIANSEDFLGQNTDNGGSLTGYYRDSSLKKIIEWIGLSNKVIQNEYCLNNSQLIFIYSTEDRYIFNEHTQSFDYSKLENIFNGRYYFENEKLIKAILSDKKQEATKEQAAAIFLTSSKRYLKLLNAKLNKQQYQQT